jgi:hypothetical protein
MSPAAVKGGLLRNAPAAAAVPCADHGYTWESYNLPFGFWNKSFTHLSGSKNDLGRPELPIPGVVVTSVGLIKPRRQ